MDLLNKSHQSIAWTLTFSIANKYIKYVETLNGDFHDFSDELDEIAVSMVEGVWDAVMSHHRPYKHKEN